MNRQTRRSYTQAKFLTDLINRVRSRIFNGNTRGAKYTIMPTLTILTVGLWGVRQ